MSAVISRAGFRPRRLVQVPPAYGPILVAVAYFIGAQSAFLIGTLSDKIFAPFWPPNVILFVALLLAPLRRWWLYLLWIVPAHVAAELTVNMKFDQQLVAYVSNCLVACLNAYAVRRFVGESNWFENLRKASFYILITGLLSPALVALGGGFVQVLSSGSTQHYVHHVASWYASNALGCIALGPVLLLWLSGSKPVSFTARSLEALILSIVLIVGVMFAFDISPSTGRGYLPSLLYLPLPVILWLAVRFGVKGAAGTILVVSLVVTGRTLNGANFFTTDDVDANVLALQIFLIGLSAPILLLGAAIEQAHRAQQLTREGEERMARAAASSSLCLWQYDIPSGKFWTTEYCRSLFGLPSTAPVTVDVLMSQVHPNDFKRVRAAMKATTERLMPLEIEFRLRNERAGVRWITARAQPSNDSEGVPTQITGTFVDISARKAVEVEASKQRDEAAHLMRVSMLAELSGSLAHELTQPLTAILSNAQAGRIMLDRGTGDPGELGEIFDDIIIEDRRAGEVIHRLRKLLKKGEVKYEAVDINVLIDATIRLLHAELVYRRIVVKYTPVPSLAPVLGDQVQLQQVLLNLLMNAMDAMDEAVPKNRVVDVSASVAFDGLIEVRIKDHGIGLLDERLARVFQPFYTTKKRGLGLGLSICASIVKSHGGNLSLQNNIAEGATASFTVSTQKGQDAVQRM